MSDSSLFAISPVDGRYHAKLTALRKLSSEFGLIQYRYTIELQWLITLIQNQVISLPNHEPILTTLSALASQFELESAQAIKNIETTTNHDVKAVEYFLREQLAQQPQLTPLLPFIHFGCTSEDINNLAYGLMLNDCRDLLNQTLQELLDTLRTMAHEFAKISMLSRTHGQAATPTTLGKELANITSRLQRQSDGFNQIEILGKCNGAVGNYNAHLVAFPDLNWPAISQHFVESLGLTFNPYTTQIEPHDALAELLHGLARINTILIDFSQDTWHYISRGYFQQNKVANEVGSSTMPHKINPIDFENAEGNLGIANALANHLAAKLPISRLQRDLSDSTTLRNLGVVFGHSLLAYQSLQKGLSKLQVDNAVIQNDLNQHWEILAEPIQTVLRAHGITDAYEQLKGLTRGTTITAADIHQFIESLDLPSATKDKLLELTPANYLGKAIELSNEI